jgi:alkylation response protein AidB-like acyl-CoA dehydrogenase
MVTAAAGGEGAALLATARALLPRIRAAGDQAERDERLPETLVAALADAGLFRMLLPRSVGGAELPLADFVRVVEAVATADASTAWCLSQGGGCSMSAAYLEPAAAQEIFGSDRRAVLAWGPGTGQAVVVAGGFRISGRWTFASGYHHATWLGGSCRVVDAAGQPVLHHGRPDGLTLLFPAEGAATVAMWQVSGLRGTGSDGFTVADLFVPQARALRRDDLATCREPGTLYRFTTAHVFPSGFAGVALGIARGFLDDFVAFAGAKTPRGDPQVLRENAVVQSQVAQADAAIRAARAFLFEAIDDCWAGASQHQPLTPAQRARLRLAATHAIHQAVHAVDRLFHAAGSSAILVSQPFERRFRDVHAVQQQVQGRQAHFESVGRFLLGLDLDPTWI